MRCDLTRTTPFAVKRSLEKFGANIRIARLKRGLTAKQVADSLNIHRTTYGRLEAGDPMVAVGTYANALYALGFGTPLDDLVDPRRDEEGMLLDLQRLPSGRGRAKGGRSVSRCPVFHRGRRAPLRAIKSRASACSG
jgi:transcriptional regulator with XRE-family HTH domain